MPVPSSIPWRTVVAAVAGLAWCASFPLASIAGLAWIVPGLLLAATAGATPTLAFRIAYFAGALHYLGSLSWLRFIPFPAGAYAGWFALSLFLALFPALWTLAAWRLAQRLHLIPPQPFPFLQLGQHFTRASWLGLNAWFLASAAAWVAWEMLLARLFGGFPWNLLGVSQYRTLPLIQIASVTGVYGVSFLIVWFSTSLFVATTLLLHHPDRTAAWRRPLLFPALLAVLVAGHGFLTLRNPLPSSPTLRIAAVQPSIPQTVIFDPDAAPARFETLLRLTEQALTTQPDLLLWPEASLPGGLSDEQFQRLTQLIQNAQVWTILGSDDSESSVLPDGTESHRFFNAAFLLDPQGNLIRTYRKRRLVMFGEYIPFGRWFPFLQRLAPIGEGFHPGVQPVPFTLGSPPITTSVVICFEDNFPHLTRQHATREVAFLVNITNNAWFGESAAQWQHAANAAFRAIENGRPLVRCANNGLTVWIDPRGRYHATRLRDQINIYQAGFEVFSVPVPPPLPTLYNRIGDTFGWTCVAVAIAGLLPVPSRFQRKSA